MFHKQNLSMSIADFTTRRFGVVRRSRTDYKEKLARKAAALPEEAGSGNAPAAAVEEEELPYVARVRALAERQGAGRVVFQSVAVTALRLIERVRCRTAQAAEAALSLGQQDKLRNMEHALVATADALQSALSTQGAQMLGLCGEEEHADDEEGLWWFALTEAIEALEESAQQMDSLSDGQPEGSVASDLSRLVADLLRRQHTDLLVEADQWID